jgi:hypothetical protein
MREIWNMEGIFKHQSFFGPVIYRYIFGDTWMGYCFKKSENPKFWLEVKLSFN